MANFDGFDMGSFGDAFGFDLSQLQEILSWRGGPVNWNIAKETALSIAEEPQFELGDDSAQQMWVDAVNTADGWLAPITNMPSPNSYSVPGVAKALSPYEWVEQAVGPEGIARYVEPIASGMHKALERSLQESMGAMFQMAPPGAEDPTKPLTAMGLGLHVGQIVGHLSKQLLGAWDLSVPTIPCDVVALIGGGVSAFAKENNFDLREVEFVFALRECAHRRLFSGVPWLLEHLSAELRAYGEAAIFDTDALMKGLGGASFSLDPDILSNPEQLRDLSAEVGAMHAQRSPEQEEIEERIQTLAVLIHGYTDVLLQRAGANNLPNLQKIRAAIEERLSKPGVGESFLLDLLGLQLRREDINAGTEFCDAVVTARGASGLNRVWVGPEYLPSAREVDNPSSWLLRIAREDVSSGSAGDLDEVDVSGVDFDVPTDLSGLEDM